MAKKRKTKHQKNLPKSTQDTTEGCLNNEKLKESRENKGFTQKEVAEATDISVQTLSRLEQKPSAVGTKTLVKLAKCYGVSCGSLLGEERLGKEDGFEGQKELIALGNRFLKLLSEKAKHDPKKLLNIFISLLEGDPKKLARMDGRVADEEKIFGCWWSVLAKYEKAEWSRMAERAEELRGLAEELGRPHLAVVGRAYKAQALCRTGSDADLKKAYRELAMIPEDSYEYESGLIKRLLAEVLRRQGNLDEAIKMCERAEKVMEKQNRDDVLSKLELVKLKRYIGTLYSRKAREMKEEQKPNWKVNMKKGDTYFDKCDALIKNLKKELPREAMVEEMLLAFSKARHHEIREDFEKSFNSAQHALKLAQKNEEEEYCAEVTMFLVNTSMQLGEKRKDDAVKYYASLLTLRKYQNPRLQRYWDDWVRPHISELSEWAKN